MSDILLQKPQAEVVVALAPQPEDRLVFEFDPSEALLERQGDNLVLSFEDGSVIELTDFYIAYTSENMPEFVIGESIVPGEAFFAALSEDLMPAAGNEGSNVQNSGSNVGLENGNLLGGLGSEGGLDQRSGNTPPADGDDDFGGPDNIPPADGDGAGGGGAGAPVEYAPEMVSGPKVLTTDDSFIAGGTMDHKSARATDEGKMTFTSEDSMDGGKITIGGEVAEVTQNPDGTFSLSQTEFEGTYGDLNVTSLTQNADGSYTLKYEYTQDTAYLHNKGNKAKDVEDFTVKIQDGNETAGSEVSLDTEIKINIKDDGVILKNTEVETDQFVGGADASQLKAAVDGDGTADVSWSHGVYKGKFYNNDDTGDKSSITVGSGEQEFSITGAVIKPNGDVSTSGVTIGWREDKFVGDIKYADGIGMKSSIKGDSDYEVAAGSASQGTEALIIEMPNPAYGIDLSFGCLFNAAADGGDAADINDEIVRLEFYNAKGELVHSVNEVSGVSDGNENFTASVILEDAFTEVRIIPVGEKSDFVLTGVQFPELSRSGHLTVEGADVAEQGTQITLDSVTIDGKNFTKLAEGESLTLTNGTVLTMTVVGGEYIAQNANGDAYFSVILDADNNWTINQFQKFDGEIDVTFAVTDPDGKEYTLGLGGTGDDTMQGGNSEDKLYGQEGDDNLSGGKGDDTLVGGKGDDTLNGGKGDDNLNGGKGDDDLGGGKGDDTLTGGKGDDDLDGNKGNDLVIGKAGNDTLDGGIGDDELFGNDGDDIIFGGSGNDYIVGGKGADELYGDAGDDLILMDMNDVFVDGGSGMDVLLVGASDLAGVRDMMSEGDITDMEVIIAGDVKGTSTEEVFGELGISSNENGNIELGEGWTAGTASGGFTEFTNQDDSVTILVETIKLETGTA